VKDLIQGNDAIRHALLEIVNYRGTNNKDHNQSSSMVNHANEADVANVGKFIDLAKQLILFDT
jgi:hypothetical protein